MKKKIIVRTGKYSYQRVKIGKMYYASICEYTNTADLSGGWDISKGNYRFATDDEIKAFKAGYKNINDIPKSFHNHNLNYPIF